LAETWPRCFHVYEKRRRPLALGIHRDIIAARPDIDIRDLSAALRLYVSNHRYLRACAEGADRIGLNGEAAGKVSAKDAASAAVRLAGRKPKTSTKTISAPKSSPVIAAGPRRLSLADLKAAALKRKTPVTEAIGAL
jgi:sRNA-binding protein